MRLSLFLGIWIGLLVAVGAVAAWSLGELILRQRRRARVQLEPVTLPGLNLAWQAFDYFLTGETVAEFIAPCEMEFAGAWIEPAFLDSEVRPARVLLLAPPAELYGRRLHAGERFTLRAQLRKKRVLGRLGSRRGHAVTSAARAEERDRMAVVLGVKPELLEWLRAHPLELTTWEAVIVLQTLLVDELRAHMRGTDRQRWCALQVTFATLLGVKEQS